MFSALKAVFPNLESTDILGLKLPEALTISYASQDFWESPSKNIWGPKAGKHQRKEFILLMKCDLQYIVWPSH